MRFQLGGLLAYGLALKKTSGQHANYRWFTENSAVVMGRSYPGLVASSESQVNPLNQVPEHLTI